MSMCRLLASIPLVLALAAGCSTSGDDSSSSESMQTANEKFAPYPTEIRAGLNKLGRLDPLNVSVGDFSTLVRDQGSIASCASFGFLGLLENQMFNNRGISP